MTERGRLEPGAQIDRFEIVRLLGSGGMGAVYEARDPELDRSVALKVIREPDPQLSLRLIREAQALAQLQHPNVVTVHECGADGDEVFVAMELVDGASFDRLSPKPATWREVVDLFVQAGRGLAAAHAKELVHRDVKPSNLFVDRDGRVRVGDFGLARRQRDDAPARIRVDDAVVPMDSAETVDMLAPGTPEPPPATALLSSPLTQEGSQIGTPRYMAPEQKAGHRATAASDQYAFCVALQEMLPARVPGWLTRAVERGLAKDPEARHPSMQELVDVLAETPRRMQRRALLGTAVLGAATVAGAFLLVANRGGAAAKVPAACSSGPSRMAGVWDDDRRAAVQAAFAAADVPYAADSFARVAATLDRRRDEWITMHREACEATHVHKTQSPEMLDRRIGCLEERRADLDGFVTALTTIQPKAVDNADAAADDVARVEGCADTRALERNELAPVDPEERAAYDQLIADLGRIRALMNVGEWKTIAAEGARIAAEAELHGWKRLSAQGHMHEGNALFVAGDAPKARAALEAAARDAADAGDDTTAMYAWHMLVPALIEAGDLDSAKALLTAADSTVRRAGNPPRFRVSLLMSEAWIAAMSGDMKKGREIMRSALDLAQAEIPEMKPVLIQAMGNLASIETQLGEFPSAIAHRRGVLEMSIERFGEIHPSTSEALAELGQTLGASGDGAAAREALSKAVASLEALHGPDSPKVAAALQSLANAQEDQHEAERIYERVVAINEKKGTSGLGRALVGLAQTRLELKDLAGARDAAEQALAVIEKRLGTENMEYAAAESAYAMAVGCSAKARLDHAIAALTRELGAEHGMTVEAIAARKKCK